MSKKIKFGQEKTTDPQTIEKYLDDILADEKNHTQAAIVIQNIRRECANIDELDPVPFLQHINELKASGGTFYDVNSGRLDERKSFGNDKKQGKTGLFGGLFGSMMPTFWMPEFTMLESAKSMRR